MLVPALRSHIPGVLAALQVFNRMVIFFSHRLLHRVVPFRGTDRNMLTMWFHGKSIEDDEQSLSSLASSSSSSASGHPPGSPEHWMELLQQPSMQRLLSKALYNEDWDRSYVQAHREAGAPLQESLRKDVEFVNSQPGLSAVVNLLREVCKDHKPVNIDKIDPDVYYPSEPPTRQ